MTGIPLDYETLRLIWWALLGALLMGFAVMGGRDLGIGALLPFVARTDEFQELVRDIEPDSGEPPGSAARGRTLAKPKPKPKAKPKPQPETEPGLESEPVQERDPAADLAPEDLVLKDEPKPRQRNRRPRNRRLRSRCRLAGSACGSRTRRY